MYKIKFIGNPKFNTKNNKVVCVQRVGINGLSYYTAGYPVNKDFINLLMREFKKHGLKIKRIKGQFVVTGTALCHENDNFDLVKGKHIAQTRMRLECYKIMKVIHKAMDLYIYRLSVKNEFAKDKTDFLIEREINHLKKLQVE